MRILFSLTSIIFVTEISPTMGAEAGMPQLNPEFWIAQVFWLVIIFIALYVVIWKLLLPKISDSIENRKKHIINDLNEAQKLKENAEKKLEKYKKVIQESKNQAKMILMNNNKKLEDDIGEKKEQFEKEIESELFKSEKQIKKFQKSSIEHINKIAVDLANEIIKSTLGSEINMSSLKAIVEEISKKESRKYL